VLEEESLLAAATMLIDAIGALDTSTSPRRATGVAIVRAVLEEL
jgi:hypothetical protein